MMKNMLENRIREHAGELFGSELPDGHRERFAEKLAVMKKKQKELSIGNPIVGENKRSAGKAGKSAPFRKIYGWVAAAAIFAGIVFFYQRQTQPAEINGEDVLSEVQNYYIMQFEDEAATV
jgi:hypothetical protein